MNRCLSYVSCRVFIFLSRHTCLVMSDPAVVANGKWTKGHNTVSMENSLHFAWKLCPVYCHCFFLSSSFQCRWSICSIHFNGLSSLVLVMKDVVIKEQQTSTPLYDLLFSTWSVFFWYTFVFVIAAKKKCHNLWTCICICGIYHTVLIFVLQVEPQRHFSSSLKSWTLSVLPTLFDTWAQDTKPKACCHLLE